MSTKNSISKTESSQELLNIKRLINYKDLFIEYYEDKYRENGNSFNPFQPDDKNPSFKLYDDHGCDFGNDNKTYDIFDLHELKFKCSKAEAIRALKARAAGGIVTDPPTKSVAPLSTDKPKFDPWKDGKISLTYAYTDEKGELLYENMRFVPKDPSKWPDTTKAFIQRRPDANEKSGWSYKLAGTKRVPFGLPELIAAPKDQAVYICEGEKDTLAMREVGFMATSVGSAKTGPTNLTKHKVVDYFSDRHVILVADKDDDGRKYVAKVAPVYAAVAASVKIIEMPGDGIKDPGDFIEKHGQAAKEMIDEIVAKAPLYKEKQASSKPDKLANPLRPVLVGEKPKIFQLAFNSIVESGWVFYLDQNGSLWVTLEDEENYINLEAEDNDFVDLLRHRIRELLNVGVGQDLVKQLMGSIRGTLIKTKYPRRKLSLRSSFDDELKVLWVDSGQEDWSAYRITADGWTIEKPKDNFFRREQDMGAFACKPETERVEFKKLFEILGINDIDKQTLISIWIAVSLLPHIERPMLVYVGCPGSGKSELSRITRSIVDPHMRPLKSFPTKSDDLKLILSSNAVPVFDNVTKFDIEMSDTLCQAVTEGSSSKRRLFTDKQQITLDLDSAIIMNAVSSPVQMGDLASRTFFVELDEISRDKRTDKIDLSSQIQKILPGLQATILDCISAGLKNISEIRNNDLHRLTDAHRLSLAMADKLGISKDVIESTWKKLEDTQAGEALENDNWTTELISYVRSLPGESLTASTTEILNGLMDYHENKGRESKEDKGNKWPKDWPNSSRKFGKRLNMLKSPLRTRGLIIREIKGVTRTRELCFDEKQVTKQPDLLSKDNKDISQNDVVFSKQPTLLDKDIKDIKDITFEKDCIFINDTCHDCKSYRRTGNTCELTSKRPSESSCPVIASQAAALSTYSDVQDAAAIW